MKFFIVYKPMKSITKIYSCKQIMFLQSTNFRCHTRSKLKKTRGSQSRYFRNTRLLSWEIFCEIFQQTHIWSTAALKQTLFISVSEETSAAITDDKNALTSNKPDDSYFKSVIPDSWSYTSVWKRREKSQETA